MLHDYLNEYSKSLPDNSLVRFYENTAANAVLLYFAQQAKDNCINYFVKVKIPNDIFVSDTDISVIFGNLIENALESCKNESGNDRKILDSCQPDRQFALYYGGQYLLRNTQMYK